MLKKSASRETRAVSDEQGNDCHFSVPRSSFKVQLFTRCGLARGTARLGAPGLGG